MFRLDSVGQEYESTCYILVINELIWNLFTLSRMHVLHLKFQTECQIYV